MQTLTTKEQPEQAAASQWWRWVLMPIAAFAGSALGTFLLMMFIWLSMKLRGGFYEDGWMYRYVMPLIAGGVTGWLYALIAYSVAPKGKLIAATVMVTLLGTITMAMLFFIWVVRPGDATAAIRDSIQYSIMMVAAILTLADQKK